MSSKATMALLHVFAQRFDSASFALLIFSLLVSALLLCIHSPLMRRAAPRLRLPPGPRGLPVLGHLHLLGSSPHQSLTHLSKIYGPLLFLRLGSAPVIVASSPAMARLILQTHDRIFAWRPQTIVAKNLFDCKDILYSPPHSHWKFLRQLCSTELFGGKRLDAFRPMIANEVRAMLCAIAESSDKVHLRSRLYATTSNIISTMAVGKRVSDVATKSQAEPSYNLVSLLVEMIHLTGSFNVADYIPWLAPMDLQGFGKKSKAVTQNLHKVWQELIDERRSLRRQPDEALHQKIDFLDVLLSLAERGDVQISDTNIMTTLTDMYAAAIETSAIFVEWAFGELLANPHTLKKLKEELEGVVGTCRLVCESDIHQLPYLRAVIKETMRLHPPAPFLVPHMASQQCQLSEFDIPLNTHVYVNVWAIGRDPTIWDKPLEFSPERFLDSVIDMGGQHFELLPFGSGRRGCPAMIMGLSNVQIMLANLFHVFDWTIEHPISLKDKYSTVLTMEQPIIAEAYLKVSKHLLET